MGSSKRGRERHQGIRLGGEICWVWIVFNLSRWRMLLMGAYREGVQGRPRPRPRPKLRQEGVTCIAHLGRAYEGLWGDFEWLRSLLRP
jgi:hypothetical protein